MYKQEGQTPLEVIQDFKATHPEYARTPLAYAGRLDPMAEGELLVLVGEACKERDTYLGLDKAYSFEVLVGIGSDTHDILGLSKVGPKVPTVTPAEIARVVDGLRGRHALPYPAFSSKTVQGKALFQWALEERLDEITIPSKQVEVYQLINTGRYQISRDELAQHIVERISKVQPVRDPRKKAGRDFRRQEVLAAWRDNLEQPGNTAQQFTILQFDCVCSSGTYMRVLARIIGEQLGTQALAWRIQRTKIGRYHKIGRWGIWSRVYR